MSDKKPFQIVDNKCLKAYCSPVLRNFGTIQANTASGSDPVKENSGKDAMATGRL